MANDRGERTEKATPKRRSKERNKGHIAKSQDFTTAFLLTCGVFILSQMGGNMLEKLKTLMIETFSNLNPHNISDNDVLAILTPYFTSYANIVILFFFLLAICAVLILRLQTGSLFAKEAIKPRLDKLKPANMLKNLATKFNIFKPQQMVEFVKSIVKTIMVAMVGFKTIMKRRNDLFGLIGADPATAISVIGSVLFELLITICVLLIIIGIIDRKYQEYEYEKSIKMTKQEVKDEFKNTEGDPKIKGKIRSFQMKIMQQKMMANVKEADVVVVNPTHYAVALKYQPGMFAPVVLAKGVDFIAFKIREIAKNNGIPIIENKPLARSLYKLAEVNKFIPEELYVAVSEILRYVYSRK